jgi:hypothetical protein
MSSTINSSAVKQTWQRGILPGVALARQAFREDLPQLLEQHAGQWVAYRGKHRLGFSHSQRDLYKQCLDQGFSLDEVLVCSVEPDEPMIVDELPEC